MSFDPKVIWLVALISALKVSLPAPPVMTSGPLVNGVTAGAVEVSDVSLTVTAVEVTPPIVRVRVSLPSVRLSAAIETGT